MKKSIYILLIGLVLGSCKQNIVIPPIRPATEFSLCVLEYYGNYYDSVACNVVSIDLYSDGLLLDSTYHIHGTGTNLYLSDVFFPLGVDVLPSGTYRADSTGGEMSYLPGMDFDGNPTGAYLLQIKDNIVSSITLCVDSTMLVNYAGDTLDLKFSLVLKDKKPYEAHYRGVPQVRQK